MIELHGTSNKWLRLAMSGGLAYISFSHVTTLPLLSETNSIGQLYRDNNGFVKIRTS